MTDRNDVDTNCFMPTESEIESAAAEIRQRNDAAMKASDTRPKKDYGVRVHSFRCRRGKAGE